MKYIPASTYVAINARQPIYILYQCGFDLHLSMQKRFFLMHEFLHVLSSLQEPIFGHFNQYFDINPPHPTTSILMLCSSALTKLQAKLNI